MVIRRYLGLVAVSIVMIGNALAAQAPDPAATKAALARLDFMIGRWEGDAWQLRGTERVQTRMLEIVERKLGGTALLVEGRGTMTAPGAEERVVHHALGIISFEPNTGKYTLRSYLATGQSGEFELTLVDGGVMWMRDVPGGRIRNTARFTENGWHEVGEFSRDGTAWTQTMEMRLRRQP
jgi:hypothetical protein